MMRTSEGALALITDRHGDGSPRLLALWNAKWGAYHFAGGHRVPGESFRECLVRELAEELDLREGADFVVESGAPAPREYVARSASAGVETRYVHLLFTVHLTPDGLRRLDDAASVAWLDDDALRRGSADDGRPISPTMRFLLEGPA